MEAGGVKGQLYRLVELDLLLQVLLHDPVVVVDAVAVEVVHLGCGRQGAPGSKVMGVAASSASPPNAARVRAYLAGCRTWCWPVWPW